MRFSTVNPYWLLLFNKIVISRAALEALMGRICGVRKEEA
jgi:hypothetical protein